MRLEPTGKGIDILADSPEDCSRIVQDHELHYRRDYSHRYPKYWLAVLDCVDGNQPAVLAHPLLLLSGNRSVDLSLIPGTESIVELFIANRSLEDIDAYYRTKPSLIVVGDRDAICRGRPQKYIDREEEEIERTAASKGVGPVAAEHVEWTSEDK